MKAVVRTITVLGLVLAVAAPAHARQCEGVQLPNQVDVAGTRLHLNGMGVREATVMNVNVYVAGLYLEHRSRNPREIVESNTKKRLVLAFVRDVERADLTQAFDEGFRRNAGGRLGAIQARMRRMLAMFSNIREGMRVTFTYVPGTGLQVAVGNRTRGVIEGEDFARVFFSIFVGPRPPNQGLKNGLLGGSCG